MTTKVTDSGEQGRHPPSYPKAFRRRGRSPGARGPYGVASQGPPNQRTVWLVRVAALTALLVLYEGLRSVLDAARYFAPVIQVAQDGVPYLLTAEALEALRVTSSRVAIAFALATAAGVLLGLLLSQAGRYFRVVADVTYMLYTLPKLPFYPLFVLWLGLGFTSEVAFGVAHGVLPITFGVMNAAHIVPTNLIAAARSMGASGFERMFKVVLPSIVPEMVGALRLGASLTVIGVVVGNLIVAVDGVGPLLHRLATGQEAASLNALILAVCAGAVVMNVVVRSFERRLSRWRT